MDRGTRWGGCLVPGKLPQDGSPAWRSCPGRHGAHGLARRRRGATEVVRRLAVPAVSKSAARSLSDEQRQRTCARALITKSHKTGGVVDLRSFFSRWIEQPLGTSARRRSDTRIVPEGEDNEDQLREGVDRCPLAHRSACEEDGCLFVPLRPADGAPAQAAPSPAHLQRRRDRGLDAEQDPPHLQTSARTLR